MLYKRKDLPNKANDDGRVAITRYMNKFLNHRNEIKRLKWHVKVNLLYMAMQLVVSLGFIYVCPPTVLCHWMYLIGAFVVLAVAYVLFKKKYYHLHEEYLASLKKYEAEGELCPKMTIRFSTITRRYFDQRTKSCD